ncbi:MAG: hypothetical protein V9G24_13950 [Rhodoblastus sp.]
MLAVVARLEQADAGPGVFAQAARDRASARPAAEDDEIELFHDPPPLWFSNKLYGFQLYGNPFVAALPFPGAPGRIAAANGDEA